VDLTNDDVADILALLDSLPYDELDLRTSRFRLTLRRAPGGWTQATQVTAEPDVTTGDGGLPTEAPPAAASASERAPSAVQASPRTIDVTAPLPGTFYRAPRPGAAPFVEAGSAVEPDTVVAIVETMKLMNPVHAGTRGTVAEILAGNAEPVAQGAILIRIEPA
jgi:acetyl-CoA carboxylase biotin carboxyl carrier protein